MLPLITIPYLLKVLTAEGFGVISFALAYTSFFIVFTDYGYNLLGTRKITIAKNDQRKINTIYSTMLGTQLILTIIAAMLFILSVFIVPQFAENKMVFLATFGIVIGTTLLPTWFFQGIEHFKTLNWIQFGYRLIYTVLTFSFVQNKDDMILVPLFNSVTTIVGGIIGLGFLHFRYNLIFRFPTRAAIYTSLREGKDLFFSAISVTAMQHLPVLSLGFFTNQSVVGYFSFVEKVVLVVRLTIQILSSVLFPQAVAAARKSYEKAKSLLQSIELRGGILLLAFAIVFSLVPQLLKQIDSPYTSEVVNTLLPILAFYPLFFLFRITSQQMLLAFDHDKLFARIQISVAVLAAFLLPAATYFYSYTGTAFTILFTELILVISLRSNWNKVSVTRLTA